MFLVIDLEMCSVRSKAAKKAGFYLNHEIIQIGAVILDDSNRIVDAFISDVCPEYGSLDPFVRKLTGITAEQLKRAPKLRAAVDKLDKWMKGRECVACSWNEVDLTQLSQEMRQKKIRSHRIEKLFDNWVDMQKSFSRMLGDPKAVSLQKALALAAIQPVGQLHNGLSDANNTALLIAKVARHGRYHLDASPVRHKMDREPLSYTLGDRMPEEVLKQFGGESSGQQDPEGAAAMRRERWGLYRTICGWIYGKEQVSGANWEKMKFHRSMKFMDLRERLLPR